MKLHIGGRRKKFGWKILNIQPGPGVDYVGDISDLGRFADGSIDQVYASHVLEHVPQARALATLAGIHRVLAPDGRFYVSVPDLDMLCRAMLDPALPTDSRFQIMRMMFGAQEDAHDFHYFGWNEAFLESFLAKAGFAAAVRVERFGLFDDTSEAAPYGFPISLNMIATK